MPFDERTLEALDFGAIRSAVARHAATARATARALALVPLADAALVREEQAVTAQMRALAAAESFELPRVHDVGDAPARAAIGSTLSGEELRDVGRALGAADAAVRRIRSASGVPALVARCRPADYLPAVSRHIETAIGDRGEVLDRASPALARIRRSAAAAQEDARERCQAIHHRARIEDVSYEHPKREGGNRQGNTSGAGDPRQRTIRRPIGAQKVDGTNQQRKQ